MVKVKNLGSKETAQGLRHRAVICRRRFEVGGLRRKIDGGFFASNLERSLLSGPPTSSRDALCGLTPKDQIFDDLRYEMWDKTTASIV